MNAAMKNPNPAGRPNWGKRETMKSNSDKDYPVLTCVCRGAGTCAACSHFSAIAWAGPGYRAYAPGAAEIVRVTAKVVAALRQEDAIIQPVPRKSALVCSNTMSSAVASPTESGALSCPNYWHGRVTRAATPNGYGQGASSSNAGGVTELTLLTPCPPDARSSAEGGFSTRSGV